MMRLWALQRLFGLQCLQGLGFLMKFYSVQALGEGAWELRVQGSGLFGSILQILRPADRLGLQAFRALGPLGFHVLRV